MVRRPSARGSSVALAHERWGIERRPARLQASPAPAGAGEAPQDALAGVLAGGDVLGLAKDEAARALVQAPAALARGRPRAQQTGAQRKRRRPKQPAARRGAPEGAPGSVSVDPPKRGTVPGGESPPRRATTTAGSSERGSAPPTSLDAVEEAPPAPAPAPAPEQRQPATPQTQRSEARARAEAMMGLGLQRAQSPTLEQQQQQQQQQQEQEAELGVLEARRVATAMVGAWAGHPTSAEGRGYGGGAESLAPGSHQLSGARPATPLLGAAPPSAEELTLTPPRAASASSVPRGGESSPLALAPAGVSGTLRRSEHAWVYFTRDARQLERAMAEPRTVLCAHLQRPQVPDTAAGAGTPAREGWQAWTASARPRRGTAPTRRPHVLHIVRGTEVSSGTTTVKHLYCEGCALRLGEKRGAAVFRCATCGQSFEARSMATVETGQGMQRATADVCVMCLPQWKMYRTAPMLAPERTVELDGARPSAKTPKRSGGEDSLLTPMPSSTPMDRRIAVLQHTLNKRDSVVHAAEVDGAEDDAFDRAVAALRREKAAAEKKAAWATAKKGVKHARVTSKIRPAGNPNVTRLHPHGRAREWQQHAAAAAAAQQQQAKEQEQEAAAVEDVPTGALSLRSEPPARAPLASPKTVTWALNPLTGGPAAAAFGSPALEAASANARRAMTRGIRRATAWDESSRAALFIQKRVRRFLRWRREQRALEAAAQVEAAACTIQRRARGMIARRDVGIRLRDQRAASAKAATAAARRIQSAFRGHRDRAALRWKRAAASTIQTAARRMLASRRHAKETLAAVAIQAAARGMLARKKLHAPTALPPLVRSDVERIARLQALARGTLLKSAAAAAEGDGDAELSIQLTADDVAALEKLEAIARFAVTADPKAAAAGMSATIRSVAAEGGAEADVAARQPAAPPLVAPTAASAYAGDTAEEVGGVDDALARMGDALPDIVEPARQERVRATPPLGGLPEPRRELRRGESRTPRLGEQAEVPSPARPKAPPRAASLEIPSAEAPSAEARADETDTHAAAIDRPCAEATSPGAARRAELLGAFNARIAECVDRGDGVGAQLVLEELIARNLEPSAETFDLLSSAFLAQGKRERGDLSPGARVGGAGSQEQPQRQVLHAAPTVPDLPRPKGPLPEEWPAARGTPRAASPDVTGTRDSLRAELVQLRQQRARRSGGEGASAAAPRAANSTPPPAHLATTAVTGAAPLERVDARDVVSSALKLNLRLPLHVIEAAATEMAEETRARKAARAAGAAAASAARARQEALAALPPFVPSAPPLPDGSGPLRAEPSTPAVPRRLYY